MAAEIDQYLTKRYPKLAGLWRLDTRDKNATSIFVGATQDIVIKHGDEYYIADIRNGEEIEFKGALPLFMEYTQAVQQLNTIMNRLEDLRGELRKVAPVKLFGIKYTRVGVFDIIPGRSHGITTLKHDILGVYYMTQSRSVEWLDAVLENIVH